MVCPPPFLQVLGALTAEVQTGLPRCHPMRLPWTTSVDCNLREGGVGPTQVQRLSHVSKGRVGAQKKCEARSAQYSGHTSPFNPSFQELDPGTKIRVVATSPDASRPQKIKNG